MASSKQETAAKAALAALQIGVTEQVRRMPAPPNGNEPNHPRPKNIQVSVQFSEEGLILLQKAQARLLDRGIRRAGNKGTALEFVLTEWLGNRHE